jgi:hypothetical protein
MTFTHEISTDTPFTMPKPGDTVVAMLDSEATPLVVLRVEPMIVCRAPDGSEVTLYASEVEIQA